MADPYAALKAKYGVGEASGNDDPYADLKAKYGVAAPEPVVALPSIAGLDAGPAARRAAAGMSPGPRMLSDEEAGVSSGPLRTREGIFGGRVAPVGDRPYPVTLGREEINALPASTYDMSQPQRMAYMSSLSPKEREQAAGEELGDFTKFLGAGALGGVAGKAVGGALGAAGARLAPVAPALARAAEVASPVAAGAAEGGTFNKALGGDFTTGAAYGAAVPALTAGADVVGRALSKGAPARVTTRIETNLGENVKQKTADKVTAVAKKGALHEVVERNPELRQALAVQAAEKPAEALKAVQKTKSDAIVRRDADFDRMQEHYKDKPPSSQATISGLLDDFDKLIEQSPAKVDRAKVLEQARTEVVKLGDKLRKRQGLPPANGDYSGTVLSPHDLRDLEQTIGKRAFEGFSEGDVMSVKRSVNAELYAPIARNVHSLAENTPGVNAKKFAETGKDIHVLIPVEEALKYKADRAMQGKKPFMERMTNIAHGATTAGAAIGGGLTHGIGGVVAGLAIPTAARLAGQGLARVGRRLDLNLAEGVAAPRLREPFSGTQPLVLAADQRDRGYAGTVLDSIKNGKTLQEAVAEAGQ